jgi:hypothetical protein
LIKITIKSNLVLIIFSIFILNYHFFYNTRYYIDYNSLKTKIKELKNLKEKEVATYSPIEPKKDEDKQLEEFKLKGLNEQIENEMKNSSESHKEAIKRKFYKFGDYVNEFLTELDNQVKKFSEFYKRMEKSIQSEFHELKIKNSKLTSFHYIHEVLEMIEDIGKMTDKILDLCFFVNINITAIRKILKKFDKKFDMNENPVALHYLKSNLSKSNSSLIYILQFQIIDEASALIEKMVKSLEEIFFKEKKLEDRERKKSQILNEPLLLKEIKLEELSGNQINTNIEKSVKKKFEKIKQKLEKIDDSNNLIRSGLEVWSLIIKSNIRVVDDYFKSKEYLKKKERENIKEIILEKLTPQLQREEEYDLSLQSKINIYTVLIHTFIYTMNCYIVQPTNGLYVAELGASKTLSGLIMGLTHLAAIFCTFLYSYWTNFSYKFPLIISCAFFLLGNFMYSFADYNRSLVVMGFGRFFIGFASARVVNRRYIIDQVPKSLIMFYSLLYVGLTCLGIAAGPFAAMLLLHFLPEEFMFFSLKFNNLTNPGWFCFCIWFVFFIYLLLFFRDPTFDKLFSVSLISIIIKYY